jgi:nucleoside-diphosphate-sugar epimerase
MRVFVAGDRGYLGAANVPLLQGASHQVRLDADRHDGFNFRGSPSDHDQRTEHIRHVHAHELVDFDAVVNLAAISKAPVGDLNPEATCSMNWDGAVHLGRGANARRCLDVHVLSYYSLWSAAEPHCPADVQTKRSEGRKLPIGGIK